MNRLSRRLLLADACGAFTALSSLEHAPLAIADIAQAYTPLELADIKYNSSRERVTAEHVEKGALGEYGLRKHLSKFMRIKQNYTHESKVFFFDWTGDLGVVDVKAQFWARREIVLQHTGPENLKNGKVDLLLTFCLVGEKGRLPLEPHEGTEVRYLVPLALLDVEAFDTIGYALSTKPGKAVNVRQAYDAGLLYPLNNAWWSWVSSP